jgi:hypothetical protein
MKRKIYFGMASAAVIALVLALNTTGVIGKTSSVNAPAQNTAVQTANAVKSDDSAVIKNNTVVLDDAAKAESKPQFKVPVDLEVEKGDQKNADKGSSPWKLDPVFVAQVFASLKVSPNGIQGDYPVKQEELKLAKSTDHEAVVEVNSSKTVIKKIYLKRLIKQDKTGIWTVVGYDSAS